jgi:hypothetical protein
MFGVVGSVSLGTLTLSIQRPFVFSLPPKWLQGRGLCASNLSNVAKVKNSGFPRAGGRCAAQRREFSMNEIACFKTIRRSIVRAVQKKTAQT